MTYEQKFNTWTPSQIEEDNKYLEQLRKEFTTEQRERLDAIWLQWRDEQQEEIDNDEPIEIDFPITDDDPDPYFVHTKCGAYKLHYPNEECPEFDVLDSLKQLGKDKSCIKWRADLDHWIDVFGYLLPKLGLGDWDRGADFGIYLAYRVGGWTRKELCEDLNEEDHEVRGSIKKTERLIKKHIDKVRWHFFEIVSGIENCGVSYRFNYRPPFYWIPEDMLVRFGPFFVEN